jgi:copper chaperone CopZ
MTAQTTFAITGLTCKNCAEKVKTALASYAEQIDVSADLTQISMNSPQLDVVGLNAILKKIGNYHIGAEISSKPTTANTLKSHDIVSKHDEHRSFFVTYKPLLLVFGYILLVCLAVEYANGGLVLHRFMPNFMAGFFLVFSFFKLLDLKGFASSYSMYDIAAKKIPAYGFIYPFIELGLGTAYLLGYRPMLVNAITLVVMLFSSIGVILAVINKQKIKCACLGTGFNLPMTTVTIIEDLLMAGMSAWMLI